MTAFAIVFAVAFVVVIGGIGLVMPALVPKTLPLGVSVPAARVDEPVIASAVRWYRTVLVVSILILLVVCVALAFPSPSATIIVAPLATLALFGLSYVTARSRIRRAKADGDWYQGVSTRLAADVTPSARFRPPVVWLAIAGAVLVVVFAVGVALYPGLPHTFPTHWGADGTPNVYSTKSVWSAFGLPFTGTIVVLGFYGLSWLVGVTPVRRTASDSPDQARARAAAVRHVTASSLGQLSVVIALGFGAMAIATWTGAYAWIMPATIGMLVLLLAVVVAMVVRYARSLTRPDAPVVVPAGAPVSAQDAAPAGRSDAPDDDRYWKGGMIYVNRNDPATFVPKRFGVGWTINLGSPGGMVFGIAMVVIVVAAIVVPIIVRSLN